MIWLSKSSRALVPAPEDDASPEALHLLPPSADARLITSVMSSSLFNLRAYAEAVQASYPRGHGVVAEYASHLLNRVGGRVARHLGGDNSKCGPDRSVDGVLIQTKYCSSGRGCIADCFDASGFRYWLADGQPMQIEVPKDLYEPAVAALEHRIRTGQVKGVSDSRAARQIVRRGLLTYPQARRLGRAGTLESIGYDTATGLITLAWPAGIAASLTLARGVADGEATLTTFHQAARASTIAATRSLVTHVLAKQTARTALDAALIPASRRLVTFLGEGGTRALAQATGRPMLRGAAAASYAAKLVRGNLVTATVASAVAYSSTAYQYLRGDLTGGEALTATVCTFVGAGGGTAGWMLGASAGAVAGSALPVIGTGLGAFAGGLAGSLGGERAGVLCVRVIVRGAKPSHHLVANWMNPPHIDDLAANLGGDAIFRVQPKRRARISLRRRED